MAKITCITSTLVRLAVKRMREEREHLAKQINPLFPDYQDIANRIKMLDASLATYKDME